MQRFGHRRCRRAQRRVGRKSGVQVQKIALDLLRDGHHGGLHVYPQQVRNGKDFQHVRNLESRFDVRIQYDLRVTEAGILQHYRCVTGTVHIREIVGHKLRRDRHIDRIARLCQNRFVIAIHQVPHHEVPYQSGQSIGRHQFDDRVCYIC